MCHAHLVEVDAKNDVSCAQQSPVGPYERGGSINHKIDGLLGKAANCRKDGGSVDVDKAKSLYEELETLENSDTTVLIEFTSAALGKPMKLDRVPSGGANGQSGASVFLAKNASDGVVIAVTKIFPNAEELVRELSSLERLRSKQFTEHFTVPDPLAAAQVKNDSSFGGILVSKVAQGQSIVDLIASVSNSKTDQERRKALNALKKAVIGTAKALARLHTLPPGSGREVSESYLRFHIDLTRKLASKVAKHPSVYETIGKLCIEEFLEQLNESITACGAEFGKSALVHGDAHPGNIFWDPLAGITFIETPTLHYSMDAAGAPIAAPERDISNFEQRLAHYCQHFNVSNEETETLQDTFSKEYCRSGGANLSQGKLRMFGARSVLNMLVPIGELIYQTRLKSTEVDLDGEVSNLKAEIALLKRAVSVKPRESLSKEI
jgi:hypothetical protein